MTDKAPEAPTLIFGDPLGCESFETLADLAARLQELRAKRGLQLTPCRASLDGSETFDAISVHVQDRSGAGASEWLCTAAVQGGSVDRLVTAVKAASRPQARAA